MTVLLPTADLVTYEHWLAVTRERDRQDAERRDFADRKAERLLLSLLDGFGALTWSARAWFMVKGSGGNDYFLSEATQGGVVLRLEAEEEDKARSPREAYCFHPSEQGWPLADQLASYKLWLEADEEKFHWHANSCPPHSSWYTHVRWETILAANLKRTIDKVALMPSFTVADKLKRARLGTAAWLAFERAPKL